MQRLCCMFDLTLSHMILSAEDCDTSGLCMHMCRNSLWETQLRS